MYRRAGGASLFQNFPRRQARLRKCRSFPAVSGLLPAVSGLLSRRHRAVLFPAVIPVSPGYIWLAPPAASGHPTRDNP